MALGLYGVLTVLMTWPLVTRLNLIEAGDSSYFAWVIAWTNHALLSDPLSLPHANTLHPLRYTLFLDEPIVGTSVLALPLRLFTTDPILTLNLVRLLTFFLSALGVRALGLSVGLSPLAAFAAGALFSFSSNRVSSPAHLSVLGTQYLALYFIFLHRWTRSGSARAAALAGLFFGLSAWACGYQALLAAAILPIPIFVLMERWSVLKTAPLGLAVALAFLLPLRALHQDALAPLGYERTESETAFFSAPLEGLFAASSSNRLWGGATENLRSVVEANLFPGLTVLILAAWALGRIRSEPTQRRVVMGYGALALCAWLVALGPEVRLFGTTLFPGPFAWLRDIEAFRMIRVPARASVFLTLGLSMLAAFGLDRIRSKAWRVALVCLALLEATVAPQSVVASDRCIASSDPAPPVYAWLKDQPEGAVIELPILPNDGLFQRPKFDDSVYLLRSTLHWKPLVNGYAGTEPPLYRDTREAMKEFPSGASIGRLRAQSVRYVVLHLRGFGPNRRKVIEERLPEFASQLKLSARFEDDLAFEVLSTAPSALPPSPSAR
ncbi:MAG: hypothetical protein ABI672_10725 [Vicinamibacteria bacterium]